MVVIIRQPLLPMLFQSSCCGDYLHNSRDTEVDVGEVVPSMSSEYLYSLPSDVVSVNVV